MRCPHVMTPRNDGNRLEFSMNISGSSVQTHEKNNGNHLEFEEVKLF